MGHTIKLAALGAVAFMVLDGIWLGVLMKNFYRDQLAPIVRLADGGIAPNWPAALVVYPTPTHRYFLAGKLAGKSVITLIIHKVQAFSHRR